jgi:thymidine kinase
MSVIWSGDNRSGAYIKTHDGTQLPAVVVGYLREVLDMPEYQDVDVIIIDEGHFLEDLCESVLVMAHRDKKCIYVGGLYADYMAVPFANMANLMAHANSVRFLTARCTICGGEAVYTDVASRDLGSSKPGSRIEVGGADKYAPVCANHFQPLG